MLSLSLRRRKILSPAAEVQETPVTIETADMAQWDARQTAIIICDMWDKHWCAGASARVEELAPNMDKLLRAAREKGVLIVHAPSDAMPYYAGTSQRARAQNAPYVSAPQNIRTWQRLDPAREGPLPVDDSDGGCDDTTACSSAPPYPWTRQHPALHIAEEDAISDDGAEIYNLLVQHHIENVLVLGVHTNMCVLGRPFGIRRLVEIGKNVALVRDMTDAMYNSRQAPYVNHFRGTELVVQHIETYWCPTITSDQITSGSPFRFSEDQSANS